MKEEREKKYSRNEDACFQGWSCLQRSMPTDIDWAGDL
jgi:hypothetical protein